VRPADDANWLSAKRVARELDKVLYASRPRGMAIARAAVELRLPTRTLAAPLDVPGAARKRAETKEPQSQTRRGRREFAFIVGGLWRRRRPARASDAWRLEFLCVIRRVFELGVLELHLPFENLAVIFDKPQGAVEVDFRLRPPQQTFVFEPFDVGKVA
jgi:hypothetical protein